MAKIYFNRLLLGAIGVEAIPAQLLDAVRVCAAARVREGRLSAERCGLLFAPED